MAHHEGRSGVVVHAREVRRLEDDTRWPKPLKGKLLEHFKVIALRLRNTRKTMNEYGRKNFTPGEAINALLQNAHIDHEQSSGLEVGELIPQTSTLHGRVDDVCGYHAAHAVVWQGVSEKLRASLAT